MKFCPGCGKKSDKNDLTCSRCGVDFTKVRDTLDDDGKRIPTGDTIEEGKVLNNRYKIKSLLGRGGMGRVYRAYDMQLDEDVALKMLEAGESSEVITTRFLREIKIARKITHENICRIYDLVEAEGKKFVSMQYIDGDDLQTILEKGGAVDFEKAQRILNDILDALGAIHAKGIIHRDMKPANIILSSKGKAYITDFGIAKGKDEGQDLTVDGSMIGTPNYMSPEQVQGAPLDSRSDIYSLGVVMFHMFTGQTPFDADSSISVALKHLNDKPPRPSMINPAIPGKSESLILKCLSKEPDKRPRNVDAVREALRFTLIPDDLSIQNQKTILDKALTITEGLSSEAVKKGIPFLLPLAGMILLAAFLAIFFGGGDETTQGQQTGQAAQSSMHGRDKMISVREGGVEIGTNRFRNDNNPVRSATLQDYFIDQYEITNRDYREFVKSSGHPSPPPDIWPAGEFRIHEDNYPVVGISRGDAEKYCAFNDKRLPTEEEWEYAARGDAGLYYPWGNEYNRNYANISSPYSVDVGSFPNDRSRLGIFDMAGNVREWTSSEERKGGQVYFIVRGGCFSATPSEENGRLTFRELIKIFDRTKGYKNIGFRCVADKD